MNRRTRKAFYRGRYAKAHWYRHQHRKRWERYVSARTPQLICQECGGGGGYIEPVLGNDGPWMTCGYCEGVGLVDAIRRGVWLRDRRQEAA